MNREGEHVQAAVGTVADPSLGRVGSSLAES